MPAKPDVAIVDPMVFDNETIDIVRVFRDLGIRTVIIVAREIRIPDACQI